MSLQTPIGLAWRKGYVRCCSDCFDKPYLIQEMKRNANNIVPVVVINITTKKAKCHIINSAMNEFDIISDPVLERRIEQIADFMINKKNIQKSNKTVKQKEELCTLNEKKNYSKLPLTASENAKLNTGL